MATVYCPLLKAAVDCSAIVISTGLPGIPAQTVPCGFYTVVQSKNWDNPSANDKYIEIRGCAVNLLGNGTFNFFTQQNIEMKKTDDTSPS